MYRPAYGSRQGYDDNRLCRFLTTQGKVYQGSRAGPMHHMQRYFRPLPYVSAKWHQDFVPEAALRNEWSRDDRMQSPGRDNSYFVYPVERCRQYMKSCIHLAFQNNGFIRRKDPVIIGTSRACNQNASLTGSLLFFCGKAQKHGQFFAVIFALKGKKAVGRMKRTKYSVFEGVVLHA